MNEHQGYVDKEYLENASLVFADIKKYSYAKMQISPGNQVLDAGCGPGIDVVQLAKLVGDKGSAVGIDYDSEMIAEATKLAASENLANNVDLHVHDAATLPFGSDTFNSCRSERVFMHLDDPKAALKEMYRVTQPNGRVVVTDSDWSSLSIDSQLIETERSLFQFHREKIMVSGYAGRSLFRLFKEVGFKDIEIKIFPLFLTHLEAFKGLVRLESIEERALSAQAISQNELNLWREQLQQTADNNCFFCCMNIITVSGVK